MPGVQQLSPEELERGLSNCDRPDLLQQLIEISQKNFGAHTRHFPHTVNYPWVAAHFEKTAAGSRILEIGAGANPLPLHLAEKGMLVDTIDSAGFVRSLPADENWNEWGFLDYSVIDPRISSFNTSVTEFEPATKYDAIFSVSVISLMPTPIREAMLSRCRSWLQQDGQLLLAIDLIPGTDTLWNKGGSNETPEQHGTFQTIEDQLRQLGFSVSESRSVRNVWKSRTDLYFLVAQLP